MGDWVSAELYGPSFRGGAIALYWLERPASISFRFECRDPEICLSVNSIHYRRPSERCGWRLHSCWPWISRIQARRCGFRECTCCTSTARCKEHLRRPMDVAAMDFPEKGLRQIDVHLKWENQQSCSVALFCALRHGWRCHCTDRMQRSCANERAIEGALERGVTVDEVSLVTRYECVWIVHYNVGVYLMIIARRDPTGPGTAQHSAIRFNKLPLALAERCIVRFSSIKIAGPGS